MSQNGLPLWGRVRAPGKLSGGEFSVRTGRQAPEDFGENACVFAERRMRSLSLGQRRLRHRCETHRKRTSSGAARHLPRSEASPSGHRGKAFGCLFSPTNQNLPDRYLKLMTLPHRGRQKATCDTGPVPLPCKPTDRPLCSPVFIYRAYPIPRNRNSSGAVAKSVNPNIAPTRYPNTPVRHISVQRSRVALFRKART